MQLSRNVEYPDPPTVVPSVFTPPNLPEPGHLVRHRTEPILPKKKKSIDMGLAYGDMPPDLADRHDLGPLRSPLRDRRGSASSPRSSSSGLGDEVNPDEAQALGLMDKIEDFLEEAHCVHHSASNMIATLQERPEAAAAVALSLAELSNLVGKLSPAFLAFIKGGSPAVFALLASPQFLIGTGIAAGITVVMFGGWKIVKKMVEGASGAGARQMEAPIAMRAVPVPGNAQTVVSDATETKPPVVAAAAAAAVSASAAASNFDEGTVVEELSSVERWRRGISPGFGIGLDDDTEPPIPEVEMLSKEAERVLKLERDRIDEMSEVCPDDSVSQIGVRQRSYKHYKSYKSRHSSSRKDRYDDVPERKSSRRDDDGESRVSRSSRRRDSRDDDRASHVSERTVTRRRDDDGDSRVSERSDRTARRRDSRDDDGDSRVSDRGHRHRSEREKEREREREKREHKDRDGEDGASVAGSERSYRSTRSSRSHRDKDYEDSKSSVSRSSKHSGTRIAVKSIPEEDEPNDGDNAASKLKKSTMLKQLFKGKLKDYLKEEREKSSSASSVMV